MTTEEYVKEYLFREIKEIENSHRLNVLTELTVYEKAIIYKYSEDGYLDLNEKLRLSEGKDISTFGLLLDECLGKLPDYQDVVYRGDSLTNTKIDQYHKRFMSQESYKESFFFSSSKSRSKAYEYAKKRQGTKAVLFRIISKHGKEIEYISKYNSESEVIFSFETDFRVLDFQNPNVQNNYYFITLTEQ